MAEYAFVNKKTGRKYKVVTFNKEAGEVTLVGDEGLEFTEPYSKERMQRLGYELQAS
jgi:hypothetical protein